MCNRWAGTFISRYKILSGPAREKHATYLAQLDFETSIHIIQYILQRSTSEIENNDVHAFVALAVRRFFSISQRAFINWIPSALERTFTASCCWTAWRWGGMRESFRITYSQMNWKSHTRDEVQRTEPIARKKENVAALLSMYCESVAMRPRGPAPCL